MEVGSKVFKNTQPLAFDSQESPSPLNESYIPLLNEKLGLPDKQISLAFEELIGM